MADILPTDVFPGYEYVLAAGAVTADSIVIPLTALTGLTAAEANATTGDGREVYRHLVDKGTVNIDALPQGSKPTRMSVSKANPSGIGIDQIRQSYSSSFDITTSSDTAEMVPET